MTKSVVRQVLEGCGLSSRVVCVFVILLLCSISFGNKDAADRIAANPEDGLILHYSFDKDRDREVADFSGYGNQRGGELPPGVPLRPEDPQGCLHERCTGEGPADVTRTTSGVSQSPEQAKDG